MAMLENDHKPVEFEDQEAPTPFTEPSLVDLIKQDLKELSEAEDVFIPVKGYERTGLRVKYHMPESGKELDNIARKVMREQKDTYSRNLYTAIDTMIYLCDGLYVQPADVDEPVELDPQLTGSPVTFDETLAMIVGLDSENPTARQVVRKLFGNNEMAIIAHAEKLNRWLMDTKADLSVELWQMGEM